MNRIKELRNLHGIKQNELCVKLDISQGTLSGWENGKYEPDLTSIGKLCDIFNVSIDYLLFRTEYTTCPTCGKSYSPLNKYDSAEHEKFHKRFLSAEDKYGELLFYEDVDKKRSECIFKQNNPTLSANERIEAFEGYLKYDFMRSLWNNHLDLSHDDFETFCKKEMGLASTKDVLDNIGENVYEMLCEKYGVADDTVYHEVSSFSEEEDSLSNYEISLIDESRKMNQYGRNKLLDTAKEMNCSPLYNDDYQTELAAAHERTDIQVTDEMKKHDDDIMADDNF